MPQSINEPSGLGQENPLVQSALFLAANGSRIFPVWWVVDGPDNSLICACPRGASCTDAGKHPMTPSGFHNATTDPATIRQWWVRWPYANIGRAIREDEAVLDIDGPAGEAKLKVLMNGYELPPTVEVRTGRVGGRHLLFRKQQGVRTYRQWGAELLLKDDVSGYVVAAPSFHRAGRYYKVRAFRPPRRAELPAWLLGRVSVSDPSASEPQTRSDGEVRYPQGTRDNALTSLAGAMRRRGMTAVEIEAALLVVSRDRCDPPLSDEQVRKIAVSVARYSSSEQRELDEEVRKLRIREQAREIVRQERQRELFDWPPSADNLAEESIADLEVTTWTIPGWLPHGGNANAAGPKKIGKTVLLLNLAKSAVDGEPFLGQEPWMIRELAGNVGYFNYEMTRTQFRDWMLKLNIEHPERIWPLTARGYRLPITVDAVAERMVEELKRHEVELWIIDTKQRAQLGAVTNENSNDEVIRWLDLLDQIKTEAGVLDLVVSSHFGHQEERTRGASSILGWADVNWKLTIDKDRDGTERGRFLEAEGRDVEQDPHQLVFDPGTKRVTIAGATRMQVRVDRQLKQLVQAVASNEGIGTSSLYNALTGDSAAKSPLVDKAERLGYITRVEEGRKKLTYTTAEGRAFLGSSGS
jgi:hypothetical protein